MKITVKHYPAEHNTTPVPDCSACSTPPPVHICWCVFSPAPEEQAETGSANRNALRPPLS